MTIIQFRLFFNFQAYFQHCCTNIADPGVNHDIIIEFMFAFLEILYWGLPREPSTSCWLTAVIFVAFLQSEMKRHTVHYKQSHKRSLSPKLFSIEKFSSYFSWMEINFAFQILIGLIWEVAHNFSCFPFFPAVSVLSQQEKFKFPLVVTHDVLVFCLLIFSLSEWFSTQTYKLHFKYVHLIVTSSLFWKLRQLWNNNKISQANRLLTL